MLVIFNGKKNTPPSEIKVTIGLCVKDAEKTIKTCLESILKQNYPKKLLTLIVVDGCSRDKTVGIIQECLRNAGVLSVFFSDHGKGLAFARQIIVDNTHDEFIIWVDGDAFIFENFIEQQIDFMTRNRRICVATGKYVLGEHDHTSIPARLEGISKYVGSLLYIPDKQNRGLPPNDVSIYRIEAIKQVNGFDTNIRGASEDEDIITRMRKKGWVVSVNKQAKYYVYPRPTWQGVWAERVWFGYGGHLLGHKDKSMHVCLYHIPLIHFYDGLKFGLTAYKMTCEKKSFLFSLNNVFATLAWWYGFINAHLEGYGHTT